MITLDEENYQTVVHNLLATAKAKLEEESKWINIAVVQKVYKELIH